MGFLSKWWKSSSVAAEAVYNWQAPGLGEFWSDPLVIRRGLLLATSGRAWEWASQARELELALDGCQDADGDTAAAQRAEWSMRLADLEGKLAHAAYHAFGLPPIDRETGQGVGESVVLGLVQDFLAWCEQKKDGPEE